MPGEVPLHEFKRWFAKYGVELEFGGKHARLRGEVGGAHAIFPIPTVRGRKVKSVYVDKARKHFHLTPKDGVPDREFFR